MPGVRPIERWWAADTRGFTAVGEPRERRLMAEVALREQYYQRKTRLVDDGVLLDLREGFGQLVEPIRDGVDLIGPLTWGVLERTVESGVVYIDGSFKPVRGLLVSGDGTPRALAMGLITLQQLQGDGLWQRLAGLSPADFAVFAGDLTRGAVLRLVIQTVQERLLAGLGPVRIAEHLHTLGERGLIRGWSVRALASGLPGFVHALESELQQVEPATWPELVAKVTA